MSSPESGERFWEGNEHGERAENRVARQLAEKIRSLLEIIQLTTYLASSEHQVLRARVRSTNREELVPVDENLPTGHGIRAIRLRRDSAFGKSVQIERNIETSSGVFECSVHLFGAQQVRIFLKDGSSVGPVEVARIDALVKPPAMLNGDVAMEGIDRITQLLLGNNEYLGSQPDLLAKAAPHLMDDAKYEWLLPEPDDAGAEPVELFGGLDPAELAALGVIFQEDDMTQATQAAREILEETSESA